MVRTDPRKLKDAATRASAKGKLSRALECYQQLEQAEPRDGTWPHRAGEIHRNRGHQTDAIAAWSRAVEKYAAAGFLVKAIAVCKMVLRLDPSQASTEKRLVELNLERGFGVARPTTEPAQNAPRPAMRKGPLEQIALAEVVPGATPQLTDSGNHSGITVIPIDIGEQVEPAPARAREGSIAQQALMRTPLLSDLDSDSLMRLIGKCSLVELRAKEALFRQGDRADALYVVADGNVAAIEEGPPRRVLSRLGDGEFFGEIGLVAEQPRTATIEAEQDSVLLAFDREAVSDLVDEFPSVLGVLLAFLRERLVRTLVATSPLFQPFAGNERLALANRFAFLETEAGAELVREGARAPGLFILLSGAAQVVRGGGDKGEPLATLGRGDVFGEMSLLTGEPAIASVLTTRKSLALELPAATFREVIMTHPQVLAFVGDLADERKRSFAAIAAGEMAYDEGRLQLL